MNIALRKHPVIVAIAVLIAGLLTWGFWPQPVFIEAIKVKRAPLTISIEEEGRTRVIDRYIISAPVDGVACRMQLHVGDPVEQGQILLGITPLESQVLDPRSRAQAKAKVAKKVVFASVTPDSTSENEKDEIPQDVDMPDVNDPEAGFAPTADQPYRRIRRHTIT